MTPLRLRFPTLLPLAALVALLTGAIPGQDRVPGAHSQEVLFPSGALTLRGTVWSPESADPVGAGAPGVVIVPGSGPQSMDGPGGYYGIVARQLVGLGLVALTYDKRGVGGSSGDWRSAGFEALADDVLSAVSALRDHPGVDPGRVGLWGISQAGWVLPLAADRDPRTAFVVVVSGAGTGMTAAEQNLRQVLAQCATAGGDGPARMALERAWKALYTVARTAAGSTGSQQLQMMAELDAARAEAAAFVATVGLLPPAAADIRLARRDQWFLALDIDLDVGEQWGRVEAPVLALYGSDDPSTPASLVAPRFRDTMAGKDVEIHVVEGAGHLLLDGPLAARRLHPEYLRLVSAWLEGRLRLAGRAAALPASGIRSRRARAGPWSLRHGGLSSRRAPV